MKLYIKEFYQPVKKCICFDLSKTVNQSCWTIYDSQIRQYLVNPYSFFNTQYYYFESGELIAYIKGNDIKCYIQKTKEMRKAYGMTNCLKTIEEELHNYLI